MSNTISLIFGAIFLGAGLWCVLPFFTTALVLVCIVGYVAYKAYRASNAGMNFLSNNFKAFDSNLSCGNMYEK